MVRSYEQDNYSDYTGLKTRDVKSQVGRGGYSQKPDSRSYNKPRESAEKVFARRTAQVLDITTREVPDVMTAPIQKSFRLNPLRFSEDSTIAEQKDEIEPVLESFRIEDLDWFDGAYLFDAEDTRDIQAHDLTEEGKIFIQNPASFLPVIALDSSRSGEILDMCSAPGGKAALIAALNQNEEAKIYTNEPKARRAQRMREVFGILGVRNTVALDYDGRTLPSLLGKARFDRILVDAECSTDSGINFASSKPTKDWSVERVNRMSILQKQLLTSAYDMLQPGGILVYSTCTLSPEENEEVLSVLTKRRKDAIIQPMEFHSEETVRKIKKWQGEKYPSEVYSGVVRIFPNNYMESFCLARIRKPTGDDLIDKSFKDPLILDDLTKLGANFDK